MSSDSIAMFFFLAALTVYYYTHDYMIRHDL